MRVHVLAALPLLAAAIPAAAADGGIRVQGAVMRAVPAGVPNTAGYMTMVNAGPKPDQLLSAACDCARKVEVHLSHLMNGQAMMMTAGPVTVPAGGSSAFAPGGAHLMIVGLKAPLKDGGVQTLTLKFRQAGELKIPFQVRSRIPTAPASPPASPAPAGR